MTRPEPLLILVALIACGGGEPSGSAAGPASATPAAKAPAAAPAAEAPAAAPTAKATRQGRYTWTLAFDPDPPVLGELFEAVVTLKDAETGQPIEDAAVLLDAQMPQHGHGMETRPETVPCATAPECVWPDGVYRVRGMKLHMPGAWTFKLSVKGPKGTDNSDLVYEAG